MVKKRRIVRRLSCDGRLSISFLDREALPIPAVYSGHRSNDSLRLKPFDPYAGDSAEPGDVKVIFPTGVTSKRAVYPDGEPWLQSEHWLYLTPRSRKLSQVDHPRKSAADAEKLLRQLGLISKHAIYVVIEYDALSMLIRPF